MASNKKTSFLFSEFAKIAEILIQKGADVNIAGQSGKTALILAAYRGKSLNGFYTTKKMS